MYYRTKDFEYLNARLANALLMTEPLNVGQVHAQKLEGDEYLFHEMNGVFFELQVPISEDDWRKRTSPNLPWAEDHFQERVSGKPLNPAPSSDYWPFKKNGHKDHLDDTQKFSHTYPERFWPKFAGTPNVRYANRGIRYHYGDLLDVVNLLIKSPLTRQAFLPVWFPEDTGSTLGQRVPCSLGYHFMIRDDFLSCTYMIRSCDFVRHFRDDIYMAGRLMQWIVDMFNNQELQEEDFLATIQPGYLTTHIMNLHAFAGDQLTLRKAAEYYFPGNYFQDGYVVED